MAQTLLSMSVSSRTAVRTLHVHVAIVFCREHVTLDRKANWHFSFVLVSWLLRCVWYAFQVKTWCVMNDRIHCDGSKRKR